MVPLQLHGHERKARSFNFGDLRPRRLAEVRLPTASHRAHWREIEELARACGRRDYARAIRGALRRSRRNEALWHAEKWLRELPLLGPLVARARATLRPRAPERAGV